jgi:hypothetical protein
MQVLGFYDFHSVRYTELALDRSKDFWRQATHANHFKATGTPKGVPFHLEDAAGEMVDPHGASGANLGRRIERRSCHPSRQPSQDYVAPLIVAA